MAVDFLAKVKLTTGEVGRIGDVGKTAVKELGPDATEDDLEHNFFYATDVVDTPNTIGEISNIQVERSFDPKRDQLKAGDSVVYVTGDLL